MATDLWMRLDVDYDRALWLRKQPRAVKHAWVDLLRAVKRAAPKKGYIRFRDVEDLAITLRYEEDGDLEILTQLLDAAKADDGKGAAVLVQDGYLYIVKWHEYQSTEAERSRRRRNGQTQDGPVEPDPKGEPKTDTDETVKTHTTVSSHVRPDSLSCVTSYQATSNNQEDLSTEGSTNRQASAEADEPQKGIKFDRTKFDAWFEEKFKAGYPKRHGSYQWPKAKAKLETLIRQGLKPKTVIDGLARFHAGMIAEDHLGTPYVPMASTWVNGRGWDDDYAVPLKVEQGGKQPEANAEDQAKAIADERRRLGL